MPSCHLRTFNISRWSLSLLAGVMLHLSPVLIQAADVTYYTDYDAWRAAVNASNLNLDASEFTTHYDNVSAETEVDAFSSLPDPSDANYLSTRIDSTFSGNNVDLGRSADFDLALTGFQNSFSLSAIQTDVSGDATILFNDIPAGKTTAQIDAFTNVLSIGKFNGYPSESGNPFDFDKDDFTLEITDGPAVYAVGFYLINNKADSSEWLEVFATRTHSGSAVFDDSDGESLARFGSGAIPGYAGSYEDNFDDVRFVGIVSDTPFSWLEFHEDGSVNDIGIADLQFANLWSASSLFSTIRISGDSVSTDPALSANARFVVFSSDATGLVDNDTNATSDVFVYDRFHASTQRVSVSTTGEEANAASQQPAISANGQYVVYASDASNLVESDTNSLTDIFLFDQNTDITTRLSLAQDGSQANGASRHPAISVDGRFVVFESDANNLVADDTNLSTDVFLLDRDTNQITLVSSLSDRDSTQPVISADGRVIAFSSMLSDPLLGQAADNGVSDIVVYEVVSGQLTHVSTDSQGNLANGASSHPAVSADGRYIAYESDAANLVLDDTNASTDVFVHDRILGITTRVSVDSAGNEVAGASTDPAISANGNWISFSSEAANLIEDDTNGVRDVFIHDRVNAQTKRLSVSNFGAEADHASFASALNFNGRYSAFVSLAANLLEDDSDLNAAEDIYLRFEPSAENHQYLMLTSIGSGAGSFSLEPAGNGCGGNSTTCGYYNTNTEVTITAFPESGDEIVAWTGCHSANGASCTVRMDDFKHVQAQFDVESNEAPTLTNPGDQISTEGVTVNLGLIAADADGDTLSYSASDLPPGLFLNTSNGIISGEVAYGSAGSYLTAVIVSDGQLETQITFNWTIESASVGVIDDIIIDNGDSNTTATGVWNVSGNSPPYGSNSLYANQTGTYQWTPNIPQPGEYAVYAWWTAHYNRSANAPYTVTHSEGDETIVVDQSTSGNGGGEWVLLGQFHFDQGTAGSVRLDASYDNGRSFSADAVKFEYVSGAVEENTAPTVSIDGLDSAVEGTTVTLTATVEDEDLNLADQISWVSDQDGSLGTGASISPLLTAGTHTITASVVDSGSLSGSATHVITVTEASTNLEPIILDNGEIGTTSTGSWLVSGNAPPWGENSLYAKQAGTYRWTPTLPASGEYKVYAWWTAHWNRSQSAPYSIAHNGGSETVIVDQSTSGEGGGQWVLLGTYSMNAGTAGYVELTASYANDRSFSADAIKFEYVAPVTEPENALPTVSLLSPADSASYSEGESITLSADASDSDGSITSVAFYADEALIGTVYSAPYSMDWLDALPGTYSLTAMAYDDQGASSTSAAVTITVFSEQGNVDNIIIDNGDVNTTFAGNWFVSGNTPQHGSNSLYSKQAGTYRWTPEIATAGVYEVYAWWTAHYNRSASAPYTISHSQGEDVVTVDQSTAGSGGGEWVLLGTYSFETGSEGFVELTSRYDNNRSFSADAIKWVYQGAP